MSTMLPYGNLRMLEIVNINASLSQISANTTGERTFLVPGVIQATDVIISVSVPTPQTGLGIVGWRITADGAVGVTFMNNTGAGITPTVNGTYYVTIGRIDAPQGIFQ